MEHVLTTASSFLLLILFGFFLKRLGFFGPPDHQLLSKLVMNLTLPAAAIVNFATLELTPALLSLLGLGLGMNLLTALLGWGLACRGSSVQKSFALLNWSGYNMGAFAMPYLQGFLGAAGVGAACIFDVGNAIMCTGGTYALTAVLAPEGDRLVRIMERDALSEEEARARMMSQPGDEFFEKRADYIIRNTGETSALRLQILELMNKLGL